MIRLVVVPAAADPTGPDPAGPDPASVVEELAGRARSARVPVGPVDTASDVADLRARLRVAADERHPVGVLPADLVVHASLLGDVLDDPRHPVAALVLDDGRLGALRLDPGAAGAAATRLAGTAAGAGGGDLIGTVLTALTAAGRPVVRVRPGHLVAVRPGGEPEARNAAFDALAARSEHRIRLAAAARTADGFYSTFVVRRLSRPLTGVAVRLGLSPNVVTLISLLVGLVAAWLLTDPRPLTRVTGALLLQLSLVIDCVDGEVARYGRRFTPLGAWLDGVGDRVKEYAVLAALAVAVGGTDGWLPATVAMVLMTYRHVADHHFTARERAGRPVMPGLAPPPPAEPQTARVWLRRVLQLPVGERWLLLSVAVVAAGPRWTLQVFAALVALSAVWTTGGRVLRSRRFRGLPAQQLAWLAPALRWVAEGAVVTAAVHWARPAGTWAAFVVLAAVAYHLYDRVYRDKHGVRPPSEPVRRATLGHFRRAFLVLAVVAAVVLADRPTSWLTGALLGLAGWTALWSAADAVQAWRGRRPEPAALGQHPGRQDRPRPQEQW